MQYFHLTDCSPNSLARPIVRILYGSLLLLASMLLSGCSEEQITKTTYSVPKPVLDDLDKRVAARAKLEKDEAAKKAALKDQRMLAAFVPDTKNKKFWTAKLVGEPEATAKVADDFTSFIKSWSFSEKSENENELPKWTLPKDWDVQSFNDGFGSVAKIYLSVDDEPLSVTISNIKFEPDVERAALANINRWRGQLTLEDISKANLEKETTVVELGGEKAYVMNEVGKFIRRMSLPMRKPASKTDPPKDDETKKQEAKSMESKSENKSDAGTKSESKEPAKNDKDEKSDKKP